MIDSCPECQLIWDDYRECVSQIRSLRQATEIALHSYDHEKAEALQMELASLEQKSVIVQRVLMQHQRGSHPGTNR